ncbi:MAG: FAD-dependent oxidoreductase [Candidatus Marinimicrobia bacterium]|nr:FAD-dependent oxidoreductase [Candidatus Neomarinimicrobiota bacterium]
MEKYDVIVVGGSAAGLTAAQTVRRHYPDKKILVIRKEEQVLIPCGIPYIFGSLQGPHENLIPDGAYEAMKMDLRVAQVVDVDRINKLVKTNSEEFVFKKLILATGSFPAMPPIPGHDKQGVYAILKDIPYLNELQERLKSAKNVVVIGGGFIGIEISDEIKKSGVENVCVIEIEEHCLSQSYDEEFCTEMEEQLRSRGVNIYTGSKVMSIDGNDRVESVALSTGKTIPADLIILGIGAVANADLAKKIGLRIGLTGGIVVDRAMRTSDPDIFACGDCAEKVSFFGGKSSALRLASIATLEARVAGANVFGIKRETPGTVGVWGTAIGNLAMGTAGLTEKMAKAHGYNVIGAVNESVNRHPGKLPGASKIKIKLVFEVNSGVLLGGQVRGDASAGEIMNAISACVLNRMTAEQIAMFQSGTHPLITASPIAYGIVNAAEAAIAKMLKVKE